MAFVDGGRPFDPTSAPAPAPDITHPAKERGPGGLGIHIARSAVDTMCYSRVDGRNILTLRKRMA
ncbi:MAG: ATP-binding protein [Synergistaceae bacterium]|nr:ATP-binding protein [Synergistaceae bacterium]